MPEHRIRFRGGWKLSAAEGDPDADRFVSLPLAWPADVLGPIRLVRRFGRPPVDLLAESIRLEFRDVPGLRSAHLNGIGLGSPPTGSRDWYVPLGERLAARNVLTLEVDLGALSNVERSEGWGTIALMIRPRGGASCSENFDPGRSA